MAPKPAPLSVLFHPKKNAKKDFAAPSPRKPNVVRPKPPQRVESDDEEELKLPDGPYQDYRVLSSALNGWKYDVMKFDSRKQVDLSAWKAPIKLNRKDLRRDDPDATSTPQAVRQMLGPDGNPVIGTNGKPVMVDFDGRIVVEGGAPSAATNGKGKGPGNNKKPFKKKTHQVFAVADHIRQLRKEERYPWVIEDASGGEVWTAQLEDLGKSETHAFFMPAANDAFKFVPAHRWYKFQKKLKHDLPRDIATVESAYSRNQRRDILSQRGGPSVIKMESESRLPFAHDIGPSLAPGGRKLKTVDSGRDIFGDDDEDADVKRRKDREYGEEGDLDEQLYEEDFADDDEKMEMDDNDEEAKELEERLKREYKTANKTREGYIDESEDEGDKPKASKSERAMRKLIREREGNDAYDSDEDRNPYASTEEEEEEEEIPPPQPPTQPTETESPTKPAVPPSLAESPEPPTPVVTESRPTSPTPSMGGHSLVAKRATSPKISKSKGIASRGSSPLASRANSPPVGGNSRATSPSLQTNGTQKKRKATDDPSGAGSNTSPNASGTTAPKLKKRKTPAPAEELEAHMVIDWLKNTPNATTRDCIQHFQSYVKDEAGKAKFAALVKEVATLRDHVLVLKTAFRGSGGSAANSPAA